MFDPNHTHDRERKYVNIMLLPDLLSRCLNSSFAGAMFFASTIAATSASGSSIAKEPEADFIAGADASHVAFFEAHGKVYREGGQTNDPFVILKNGGIDCIRLRLFTSSDAQAKSDEYNTINNLAYTVPLAVRVKKAGLRFLLDFHYSDTWADPAKQAKPETWKSLSFDQLEQRMYEYNRDCIAAFKKAGAMPDFVQIGNEITPGMVWPDGRVSGTFDKPEQWVQFGKLLKAALRGIKEAATDHMPKIIIHIDRGGDWKTTQWFFDHLRDQNVEFDIIGESYYPFWHGSLDDLKTCLTNAAQRYQKPVVIAETAFPWNTSAQGSKAIVGIMPGKDGQVQFLQALAAILKGIPEGRGAGIFYWATEFLPLPGTNLAGFEGTSLFDSEGNALPALKAFGLLAKSAGAQSAETPRK